MKTVDFFGKQVTKLIVGDNPFNGHSYVLDWVGREEMKEYYTAEHFKESLREIEKNGFNTMLPLADPYVLRILKEYEREGGKLQYIFQPYVPMDQEVSLRQMEELNCIGIYTQGSTTDYLFETGQEEEILKYLKTYRQLGVPVGLGTHRPELIEKAEREGWEVDFYMACMQNGRRNRAGEKSSFITGKSKADLVFHPDDRPVMLETLKKIKKPIIAFKLFAGGQMFLHKTEEEIRALIKGAYQEVFPVLKENDLGCIGVFQRDKNQVKEDADIFNEWCAEYYGE